MLDVQLIDVIDVKNTLGEGVQWNARDNSVWWTDIQACKLYRLQWPSRELEVFETPERLCAFAFTDTDDCIVAAFASGFALYDFRRQRILWQKTLLSPNSGMRFNDGKIDRQGRFWAGTMVEDDSDAPRAGLFRLDIDGGVTQVAEDIHISNGCCWDLNANRFYFADSPRRNIYRYDFDAASGDITNRQVFARTLINRYPDGATVDADGYLWSAQWRGARVEQDAAWHRSQRRSASRTSKVLLCLNGMSRQDLGSSPHAGSSAERGRARYAGSLYTSHG